MKALITGASGFVGSNLTRRLIEKGIEVHVLIRPTSNLWRLDEVKKKIISHQADFLNLDYLAEIFKEVRPDYIFHLATHSIFSAYLKEEDEKEIIQTNLIGLVNLIKAAASGDYKLFVNTGSSSEYGLKNEPMKETDVCRPANMYGVAKLAATAYGQYYAANFNKPIVTLRLFSPFGQFDDKKRLIPYVIAKALKNQDIEVSNPEVVRDYIHVDQAVDIYLKAMEIDSYRLKGEIFNIGSGRQRPIKEIVGIIAELTGTKSKINWQQIDRKKWEPAVWQADLEKTAAVFGWRPEVDLRKDLSRTVAWFKDNLSKYE